MSVAVVVEGDGALADAVRAAGPVTEVATTVVVAGIVARPISFDALTDADFERAWEAPMRAAIGAFQRAHAARRRVVALVPTIGMTGAPRLAPAAATAEAIRVMVKSAARQWGADGITVNCVAVAPSLFGIDPDDVGEVSIAPPALTPTDVAADVVPLLTLLGSTGMHHITGATLNADGGVWMTP